MEETTHLRGEEFEEIFFNRLSVQSRRMARLHLRACKECTAAMSHVAEAILVLKAALAMSELGLEKMPAVTRTLAASR